MTGSRVIPATVSRPVEQRAYAHANGAGPWAPLARIIVTILDEPCRRGLTLFDLSVDPPALWEEPRSGIDGMMPRSHCIVPLIDRAACGQERPLVLLPVARPCGKKRPFAQCDPCGIVLTERLSSCQKAGYYTSHDLRIGPAGIRSDLVVLHRCAGRRAGAYRHALAHRARQNSLHPPEIRDRVIEGADVETTTPEELMAFVWEIPK
jgi:hypothetical protein